MKRHATTLAYDGDGLKLPYAKHAAPFLERVWRVGSAYMVQLMDGLTGIELATRFKAETAKCIPHPLTPFQKRQGVRGEG